MWKLLCLLNGVLSPRARTDSLLLIIPMLLTALLEMLSIALIFPLIQFVASDDPSGSMTFLSIDLSDYLAFESKNHALIVLALCFVAVFLVKSVAIVTLAYIITWISQKHKAIFQSYLVELFLHAPYHYFLQHNTAELLRSVIGSAGVAFEALRLTLGIVMEVLLIVTAAALLLIIEPWMTLGAVVALTITGATIYLIIGPVMSRWGKQAWQLDGEIIQSMNESIGSVKDVQILGCQPYLVSRFYAITRQLALTRSRSLTVQQGTRVTIEAVLVVVLLAALLFLNSSGRSLADISAIAAVAGMAALRLLPSLNRVVSNLTALRLSGAAIGEVAEIKKDNAASWELRENSDEFESTFSESLDLKDVSFRYETSNDITLQNINLSVTRGESIGFVGHSGSGKSTLIDIILGLLQPASGRLSADGREISGNVTWWQRQIGYVPQEIYLIDDTFRRNIAFGIPDDEIDGDRLDNAIRLAHLTGVVDNLGNGLDTIIGENGIRLSGGQRQRIGIARALYRDPNVLIFDEATSSLDTDAEKEISRAINNLASSKTILIIAHRLSTVKNCDRLVFLSGGTITDVGTFAELMERNADFKVLIQNSEFSADAMAAG